MLSLRLAQDFDIICGGRAISQQVQAALTPATNESSDNYKRMQAPLLGSLIEGQPYTFKNNRRSLMTLYGLINGPFMRKTKTGPTSSTEITGTRTCRTFSKVLGVPAFVIHKKTNNRLGFLHDLKGINATVSQRRTSTQGSLLL